MVAAPYLEGLNLVLLAAPRPEPLGLIALVALTLVALHATSLVVQEVWHRNLFYLVLGAYLYLPPTYSLARALTGGVEGFAESEALFFGWLATVLILLPFFLILYQAKAVLALRPSVGDVVVMTMTHYASTVSLILAASLEPPSPGLLAGLPLLGYKGMLTIISLFAYLIGSLTPLRPPSRLLYLEGQVTLPQPPAWVAASFLIALALYHHLHAGQRSLTVKEREFTGRLGFRLDRWVEGPSLLRLGLTALAAVGLSLALHILLPLPALAVAAALATLLATLLLLPRSK
jgi:hypothetical protein